MVQGWHAMMQRQATGSEEVAATAYRAQIKPGAWQGDNTVLLFTNRGCLALQPLTASRTVHASHARHSRQPADAHAASAPY